ncbi:hypothetical protein BD289DRAFT_259821 [Coniella lustricola]|uniref:Uncharacterized protein n=1 Tax=Coniella lustricola TaxID=2025994 RepID=A0A2T3A7W7_9PEZI|nr:hypothetical protein BD289DRAFT_259821 [Coniella lustricola]
MPDPCPALAAPVQGHLGALTNQQPERKDQATSMCAQLPAGKAGRQGPVGSSSLLLLRKNSAPSLPSPSVGPLFGCLAEYSVTSILLLAYLKCSLTQPTPSTSPRVYSAQDAHPRDEPLNHSSSTLRTVAASTCRHTPAAPSTPLFSLASFQSRFSSTLDPIARPLRPVCSSFWREPHAQGCYSLPSAHRYGPSWPHTHPGPRIPTSRPSSLWFLSGRNAPTTSPVTRPTLPLPLLLRHLSRRGCEAISIIQHQPKALQVASPLPVCPSSVASRHAPRHSPSRFQRHPTPSYHTSLFSRLSLPSLVSRSPAQVFVFHCADAVQLGPVPPCCPVVLLCAEPPCTHPLAARHLRQSTRRGEAKGTRRLWTSLAGLTVCRRVTTSVSQPATATGWPSTTALSPRLAVVFGTENCILHHAPTLLRCLVLGTSRPQPGRRLQANFYEQALDLAPIIWILLTQHTCRHNVCSATLCRSPSAHCSRASSPVQLLCLYNQATTHGGCFSFWYWSLCLHLVTGLSSCPHRSAACGSALIRPFRVRRYLAFLVETKVSCCEL